MKITAKQQFISTMKKFAPFLLNLVNLTPPPPSPQNIQASVICYRNNPGKSLFLLEY